MNRAVLVALGFWLSCCIGTGQTGQSTQPSIPGVIRSGTQPQIIKNGFKGLEGPVPTPDGGIYFSAIDENRTYKLAPNGEITVWRENTRGTNGLFLLRNGRLLCAEGSGLRITSIAPGGKVTVLADAYGGKPLRQPMTSSQTAKVGFTLPIPT